MANLTASGESENCRIEMRTKNFGNSGRKLKGYGKLEYTSRGCPLLFQFTARNLRKFKPELLWCNGRPGLLLLGVHTESLSLIHIADLCACGCL